MGLLLKEKSQISSEINSWVNVLSQGGSREGVYRSIVLGDEYYQMENFDEKTKERTSEFAQYILENFVGLTINLETLQKMNFYATKRMVVEKLLEIIEAMKQMSLFVSGMPLYLKALQRDTNKYLRAIFAWIKWGKGTFIGQIKLQLNT